MSDVRVRLDLAYDGTNFAGWAAQPGLRTVEGVLSAALHTITRLPVRLTVAGRTDAGVHAAHQVAHFDLPSAVWQALPGRSPRSSGQALVERLTGVLGREAGPVRGASDVVVLGAQEVSADFDARFGALARHYRYRVADGLAPRDPLRRTHVLWQRGELDVAAMQQAVGVLVGEHDFLSFCKPRPGASTVRTLQYLQWERGTVGSDAGLVVLTVGADAFCHSMVRSLVGASLAVGLASRDAAWLASLVARPCRTQAAPVAPPHGLVLERVDYPPTAHLAAQAARAKVVRRLPTRP
ncbi:tRNA pseudouridine(38-40) synthase TruA [Buchananella hordeovulneris]|uniref:tRNA pseudouridine synthase A n=1 Tax=Buchananella hordeovulneris TaxID=52770 RepID=A0A1Q5PZ51_9ACTO|nr:tRNA pseudouridine(38-40) synthase TruA [Buchananella hordeovulneris]MDO5080217.1 tRNA pseudouridine(38-40) synthase TruA [Buchananella hordeovulneris]OKL52756.1 tRNA pseudouridine(38-40) synthase TruA [Buchananella hordeovulneris]